MKLSDREWGIFLVGDLFSVKRPPARNKDNYEDGSVPFVASGAVNNGVMKCCKPHEDESLDDGNCITVSPVDGSSFYQPFPFLGRGGAGSSVLLLYADGLNLYRGQFIAKMISNTCSSKYTYGHMGNKDSIKRERIMLPVTDDGEPDYQFMEDYVRELMIAKRKQYRDFVEKRLAELGVDVKNIGGGYRESLASRECKEFFLEDLFIVKAGKRLTNADKVDGDRPFIGATDNTNGVTGFVDNENNSIDRNVLGVNYNGAPCIGFYHPYECIFTDDVKRLHLKNYEDNAYVLLFMKSVIMQQRTKYSYGYKFNERRMLRQLLSVPVTETGEPDYEFMEEFGRKMMMNKYSQYLAFLALSDT